KGCRRAPFCLAHIARDARAPRLLRFSAPPPTGVPADLIRGKGLWVGTIVPNTKPFSPPPRGGRPGGGGATQTSLSAKIYPRPSSLPHTLPIACIRARS